jgi:hypothetical protein
VDGDDTAGLGALDTERGAAGRARTWWARFPWALRVAVVPWVLARVVVLGALAVAHELATRGRPSAAVVARVHEGLLGWDAGWYEAIARHGYAGSGHESLRFFPLLPAAARALALVPGIDVGAALVILANGCALGATVALAVLVRRESGDESLARRAAWLLCLAPPAFTLVMGYAEATLLLLAAGVFLALRGRRWWWAAGLGLAAGLTRPTGVLLAVPALIEALRGLGAASGRERLGRLSAVAAPVLGAGAFLGWVGWRYHDALAPLRIQEGAAHRGGFADPFTTLAHDLSFLVHGRHLGEALHLPWALLAVALTVVALRRFPASYGALGAAVVVVALTGSNLDGFERYALSAFPLAMAGASLCRDALVERAVYALAAAGLAGYAVLAFTNLYTP